jgi:alpha-D-ribose 1-methylphosphonate 5-triphosphate synthase subunit PhnH
MDTTSLEGGFANAPVDAAHAFRAAMRAMARPGEIETVSGATPPAPLSVAAGVLVLTLCDPDTPVHLAESHDTQAVRDWITFQTGAPFAPRAEAMFAIGTWEGLAPQTDYPIGTAEYPDRSTTLIVETDQLEAEGTKLTGPGIRTESALSLPNSPFFSQNHTLFPQGLDMFFTSGNRLAGLPRSTKVT